MSGTLVKMLYYSQKTKWKQKCLVIVSIFVMNKKKMKEAMARVKGTGALWYSLSSLGVLFLSLLHCQDSVNLGVHAKVRNNKQMDQLHGTFMLNNFTSLCFPKHHGNLFAVCGISINIRNTIVGVNDLQPHCCLCSQRRKFI